ncbi:MAG: ferritin family protein [Bacillota bacterium]
MSKVKSILEFAMRMELGARDFYNYYGNVSQSEETIKTFGELAEIENKHYLHLKKKYDDLGFEEAPKSISWVVDDTSRAVDPSILASNSDLIAGGDADGGKANSDISIIRMAFLIENDFAEFYSKAIDAVAEQDLKVFLAELRDWELGHKELFYKKYKVLLNEQWGDIASILEASK